MTEMLMEGEAAEPLAVIIPVDANGNQISSIKPLEITEDAQGGHWYHHKHGSAEEQSKSFSAENLDDFIETIKSMRK